MKKGNVLPWSFSSLQSFENCPRRYYLTRISKVVEDAPGEAARWGNEVHKALELAVGGGYGLGERFKQYQPVVDRLRATDGHKHVEQKFGITNTFRPTKFFGNDVWFRGVIDLNIVRNKTAIALDYKLGKVRTDGDQLKLFAAATFAMYPHVETVHTKYLWLAHDRTTGKTFNRDDAPQIWDEFQPRVARMVVAQEKDRWLPNPSGLCKGWCPVGRTHCEFWQGREGKVEELEDKS